MVKPGTSQAAPQPGTLYVVATPIGNLGDLTFRALATLKNADAVVAEDTRHTKKLLNHYGVATPLLSYHVRSGERKRTELLERLAGGQSLALVSDGGTPLVSDPGADLVGAARDAGLAVMPVPGASAVTAALSAAGYSADRFSFVGFLPHKKGRQTALRRFPELVQPVVIYESPHRLVKLLGELTEHYPAAAICVARELTKAYEEFRSGTPDQLKKHYEAHPPKGEVVVIASIGRPSRNG